MINIEPTLTHLSAFTISGISVRTINQDEFNSNNAKIARLWDKFKADNIIDKITNKIADTPVYGVYSDYESDFNGYYTVTAGVAVNAELSAQEFSTVNIQEGNYLVFTGQGTMPQIVVETWMRIWSYFESSEAAYTRNYKTDFELYRSPQNIEIYIGVLDK